MSSAAPALRFAQVVKDYVTDWRGRRWRALDQVTFTVQPGTLCALVGANGAGKSTVLKIAAGVSRTTAGGCEVEGQSPAGAARAGAIGYLPEHFGFAPHLAALAALLELARLTPAVSDPRAAAVAALAEVGLGAVAERRVGELSRGQRQRLGLAQAMLGAPRVLLLDEPASALDPRGVEELGRWLDARRRAGATVVLSSHFLPQLEELCDQFVLLDRGRVVLDATRRELAAAGGLTRAFMQASAA